MDYLPLIRSDLSLYKGPSQEDGSPSWTLHDPLRNRFFFLGLSEYYLLKYWNGLSAENLLLKVYQQTGHQLNEDKIQSVFTFLEKNQLLKSIHKKQIEHLHKQLDSAKNKNFQQLFTQLFFFRFPLLQPEKFLQKTFPYIRFVYEKSFIVMILLTGLVGLYLSFRQWDIFSTTIVNSFNLEYFSYYLIILAFAKLIHELGHAYTAHFYQCRVANMGLALMFFWPVLYTETSESWKLASRLSRLHIGAAGVIAELCLALIATFLWSFFPEGPIQTSLILLATVTWLSTLLINLNPFMRFDGYYLFSDLVKTPNLQERSFNLARWNLREWLFKYNDPATELFDKKKHRLLLIYAYATWIYRFFLYLGIALLVYHYIFKLAGIILMSLELMVFIMMPIVKEIKVWWEKRKQLSWNTHSLFSVVMFFILLILIIIPFQGNIQAPAVLSTKQYTQIFSPVSAQLSVFNIKPGQYVEQGDTLLILKSPDIEQALFQAEKRIKSLQWEINQAGSNPYLLRNSRVLQSELLAVLTEKKGLSEKQAQLIIKAPFSGIIKRISPGLSTGRWYSKQNPLLELVSNEKIHIEAYFKESELAYIDNVSKATFIPDNLDLSAVNIQLDIAEKTALEQLSNVHVASLYGGSIDTIQQSVQQKVQQNALQKKKYQPLNAIYRWQFLADKVPFPLYQEVRGKVRIQTKKESILNKIWRMILAVLIRESGF